MCEGPHTQYQKNGGTDYVLATIQAKFCEVTAHMG
jgi:hypothetical protein